MFRDSPPLEKREDLYKGHPWVNAEICFLMKYAGEVTCEY